MTGNSFETTHPLFLDANVVIYLFNNQLASSSLQILSNAEESQRLYMSLVAVTEVRVGQRLSTEKALFSAFLKKIVVDDFTLDQVEFVAQVRQQSRLLLPDAIVAATALARGGVLMTADREVDKVEGLEIVAPDVQ